MIRKELSDKIPCHRRVAQGAASRSFRYGWRMVTKPFAAVIAKRFGTLTHVSTCENVVSLTFDEGPHPEFTGRLLDILDWYQARATFFCLGKFAQKHPDVVRRTAEAGHSIGNHSWDHPSFRHISRRERYEQIRACAKALAPYETRLFRPPYGDQSLVSHLDTIGLGYEVIGWSVTGSDWLDNSAEQIAEKLKSRIRPGAVILLHDRIFSAPKSRYFDRMPMLEALKIIFEYYGTRFRFVTIPELIRSGRPHRENWYWKAEIDWLNGLCEEAGNGRRYSHTKPLSLANLMRRSIPASISVFPSDRR
jgi:peptidoglycan/xylan/chitin deacetylase (PgdA/CDA1 family)